MIFPRPLPAFDAPLDILEACHENIERRLGALEALVPHLGEHGCDADARAAAASVTRYFDDAGAQHHRDEDEDLFPRLRALAARQCRIEIGATLADLEFEHGFMDSLYSRLRPRLLEIAAGKAAALEAELVGRFADTYRRHIRVEADLVLPYAREVLGAQELEAMGRRMSARRTHRAAA